MLPPPDDPRTSDRYDQVCTELSQVMGAINVAFGRLVELVQVVLDEGHHVGPGLVSPAHFVAWRTGQSLGRSQDLVRLARRAKELPTLTAALTAGELTLDQAAVVARHVPPEYDASATAFAKTSTEAQLRQALPAYGYEKRTKPVESGVFTGTDDRGWWIRGRLGDDEGALIDQALASTREDLYRQNKAATPKGEKVPSVSSAEAFTSMAETALRSAEALRPGSDRYRVHLHCEQAPNGGLVLATHLGIPLEDGIRRHILCDPHVQALLRQGTTPLSVGRETRWINRKLRRAIIHRDGGCCVPGCTSRLNLEIHHICHWEDGGPTDTHNLISLCRSHHRAHHLGALAIAGNADLGVNTPGGVTFRDDHGRLLDPTGQPITRLQEAALHAERTTPAQGARDAAAAVGLEPGRYRPPTGERISRRGMHLTPDPPPEPEPTPEPELPPPTPLHPNAHHPDACRGDQAADGPPDAHGPPAA